MWESSSRAWHLTVVCKATYELRQGVSPLASEQPEPRPADSYWDADPSRSLYAPSDLLPFKPRADVMVVGHAWAPQGAQVRSLVARVSVGAMDKTIEVHGDQAWTAEGKLTEARPFQRVPLRYERAAGGPDTWNPVGMRLNAAPDAHGLIPVPNLRPPRLALTRPTDMFPPIGLGPIAPGWPTRKEKLRQHAGRWPTEDWSHHPLPLGMDQLYFNATPEDQQLDNLDGDEPIVLENLLAGATRLSTRLARARPRAIVQRPRGKSEEIELTGDTLWIDLDRASCALVFRGSIPLSHRHEEGRVVVSLDEAAPLAPPEPPREESSFSKTLPVGVVSPVRADERDGPSTRSSLWVVQAPVLPFVAPASDQRGPPDPPSNAPSDPPGAPTFGRAPSPSSPFDAAQPPAVAPPPLVALPPRPEIAAPPGREALWSAYAGAASTSPPGLGDMAFPRAGAAPTAVARGSQPPAAVEEPRRASTTPPVVTAAVAQREIIDLLWFNAGSVPRIRRRVAWKELIAASKPNPEDEELDDELPPGRRPGAKERREVLAVLTHGAPIGVEEVGRVLEGGIGEDGTFTPPLALIAGELEFPFDELETLKATLAAVSPFLGGDRKLKETVDGIHEIFKMPWVQGSPGVIEKLTAQVRQVFAEGRRGVPSQHLEAQAERALLAQRHYQKRVVLGQTRIRGLLVSAGQGGGLPAYLPESLGKELPAFVKMRVRVLAEVRGQLDHTEASAYALRVVALARVLSAR